MLTSLREWQQLSTQQANAAFAIHIDLALALPAAPRLDDRVPDRVLVATECFGRSLRRMDF